MNNALLNSCDVRVGVAPCKGCEDRPEGGGCHSTCTRYIEWKKKRDEVRTADFMYEWREGCVDHYFIERTETRRKRYKRK